MDSTSVNSSKSRTTQKKELFLGKVAKTAMEFDPRGLAKIVPEKNEEAKFFEQFGFKMISAFDNEIKFTKNGEKRRINPKTGKAYRTRLIPKAIEENMKNAEKADYEI